MEIHLTANIFTAKTTGFHCVTNPTAVSLHFLQTTTALLAVGHCSLTVFQFSLQFLLFFIAKKYMLPTAEIAVKR